MVTWLLKLISNFLEFIVGLFCVGYDYTILYLKGFDNMENVSNLAINYASLIVDGYKTFASAHRRLKPEIAICLIAWGYEDLITEDQYKPKA